MRRQALLHSVPRRRPAVSRRLRLLPRAGGKLQADWNRAEATAIQHVRPLLQVSSCVLNATG